MLYIWPSWFLIVTAWWLLEREGLVHGIGTATGRKRQHLLFFLVQFLKNPGFSLSSNFILALQKLWSFPLTISSVNVTKSAGICRFGHIYWWNPWWNTSFFVQCGASTFTKIICRGIIRIHSNIYDEAFCKNFLLAVNYFRKKAASRMFARF